MPVFLSFPARPPVDKWIPERFSSIVTLFFDAWQVQRSSCGELDTYWSATWLLWIFEGGPKLGNVKWLI